jgi:hypothetical protein
MRIFDPEPHRPRSEMQKSKARPELAMARHRLLAGGCTQLPLIGAALDREGSAGAGIDFTSFGVITVCKSWKKVPPIVRRRNQWGCVMANSQAKLMYPGLAGFYENMLPIAETFVRIVIGVMFLMHVSVKLTAGPGAVAVN